MDLIAFRPIERDDLLLLHRWLNTPHVFRWWDDPPQPSLELVTAEYGAMLDGTDRTRGFIILLDDAPAGYIQTYSLRDEPTYAQQLGVSPDASGIDLYLGDPAITGRGVGPRVIDEFVRTVVFADPEVTECIIDPAPDNAVAIRAYEKAGFTFLRAMELPAYPWRVHLMRRARETAENDEGRP